MPFQSRTHEYSERTPSPLPTSCEISLASHAERFDRVLKVSVATNSSLCPLIDAAAIQYMSGIYGLHQVTSVDVDELVDLHSSAASRTAR